MSLREFFTYTVTFTCIGTDYQAVNKGNVAGEQAKDWNQGIQCCDENPDEIEALFHAVGNSARVVDVEKSNR
jgi:hypothetical protein